MTSPSVVIAPATVPRARVAQVDPPAPPAATVTTADAHPVARPTVRQIVPQQVQRP